jgi:putative intracellular protease/amidase
VKRALCWIGLVLALGLGAVVVYLYPHRHYVLAVDWPDYDYGRPDRERIEALTLFNHERVMGEILGEPLIPVQRIAILVYDGAETLEVVAPMAAFSELMSVQIDYVAPAAGTVRTSQAEIVVEKALEDIGEADVLVVPGGAPAAVATLRADPRLRNWISRVDASSRLTLAIGAGAALLADAERLDGHRVAASALAAVGGALPRGATPVDARYVQDDKYWTSDAGSAALDAALAMVGAIAGKAHLQAAMLDLEYDPAPPAFPRSGATPPGTQVALPATGADPIRIGILVYDGFFTLDAIGPLAMLSQLDGVEVALIRRGASPVVRSGRTRITVARSIADVDALDVLIVPGGADGTWALGQDADALAWIRRIDARSRITASVCTGSWVLGEAGLLQGRRATSNWYRASDMMARYGATFVPERYVRDGKLWTSAGVSAGLDLSVALARELRGDAAALRMVERMAYWPEPPIRGGTPASTDDRVLDMMHRMYDAMMMPLIGERGD